MSTYEKVMTRVLIGFFVVAVFTLVAPVVIEIGRM